mgnify:CR=1 FL=1
MSGCVTISTSGVPPRLKSTFECADADDAAGRAADVDRLRRVLFEVRAHDADLDVAFGAGHDEGAVDAERLVVLGDLVPLRDCPDRSSSCGGRTARSAIRQFRACPSLIVHSTAVWFGTGRRTGKREAHRTRARVRLAAEPALAAAEHLRVRLELHVDLEADDRFPLRHEETPSPAAAAPRCRRAPRRSRGTPPASRASG